MTKLSRKVLAGGLLLLAAWGCSACGAPSSDSGYDDEIREYRRGREERLAAPDGWLSLIGLFWLEEGPNRFGSEAGLPIALPDGAAPPVAGNLTLEGEEVRLQVGPGVVITIDGEPVSQRVLRDDSEGPPDALELGRLRMYVIRRGSRVALRVKDPEAPTRKQFAGLDYFAIDPAYRVRAVFEAYAEPRQVEIPTVNGTASEMLVPGTLEFTLEGQSLTLEPLISEPDQTELFLIFRDETSGTETYGAGRYLYADLEDGYAFVDFNKAYNPPCAFTPYATCPLPPRSNRLAVAIRAGEKRYGEH